MYFIRSRKTWEPFSNGLTSAAVHDLVIQEDEQHLLVGTHGRSIYLADISLIQDHDIDNQQADIKIFDIKDISSMKDGVQRGVQI